MQHQVALLVHALQQADQDAAVGERHLQGGVGQAQGCELQTTESTARAAPAATAPAARAPPPPLDGALRLWSSRHFAVLPRSEVMDPHFSSDTAARRIVSYCIEYGGRNPVFTYPASSSDDSSVYPGRYNTIQYGGTPYLYRISARRRIEIRRAVSGRPQSKTAPRSPPPPALPSKPSAALRDPTRDAAVPDWPRRARRTEFR